MLRWFILVFVLLSLLFFGLMGWRTPDRRFVNRPLKVFLDMDHQYKVGFQEKSDFFEDGVASRRPVAGTIPMGHRAIETREAAARLPDPGGYRETGVIGDYFGNGLPEDIEGTAALLERGQERYEIFCTVCHGASGNGKGIVSEYWLGGALPPTANLVDGRVAALPDGKIFHTITHGQGLMGPYGGNISVEDRWAIVAYVRALQKSQRANASEPEVKQAFEKAKSGEGSAAP